MSLCGCEHWFSKTQESLVARLIHSVSLCGLLGVSGVHWLVSGQLQTCCVSRQVDQMRLDTGYSRIPPGRHEIRNNKSPLNRQPNWDTTVTKERKTPLDTGAGSKKTHKAVSESHQTGSQKSSGTPLPVVDLRYLSKGKIHRIRSRSCAKLEFWKGS